MQLILYQSNIQVRIGLPSIRLDTSIHCNFVIITWFYVLSSLCLLHLMIFIFRQKKNVLHSSILIFVYFNIIRISISVIQIPKVDSSVQTATSYAQQ